MLWDCFVCGIRDVRVQWRLLARAGLTFAKVFGLAQMSELVEKNVQDSEGTLFILCIRWSRLEGHHQGTVLVVSVSIRRQTVDMQVDIGAAVSLISESTYKRIWCRLRHPMLEKSGIMLCTYTGVLVMELSNYWRNMPNCSKESLDYDVLASMTGAKVFSKLDLSHACLQLEEESKEFQPQLFSNEQLKESCRIFPTFMYTYMIFRYQTRQEELGESSNSSAADTLAPLYKLLAKQQPWHWGKEQADAFQKAKSQLSSDVHFDPGRKLAIYCDAFPYSIGAVLSHVAGKNQGNVDALNRLQWERFLWKFPSQLGNTVLVLRMLSDADSIVTASTIRKWTNTDPLSMVRRMVLQGWESQLEPEFKPYMQRRYELSVQIGCVLWGSRVVVSPLVDAHSKWVEAAVVSSPSSQQAMQVLRHMFATHGLSDILVSDNDGIKETIMSQEQDVEDVGPLDPNMPPVTEKQPPTPPIADAQLLPPQPQPRVDPDYRPVLGPVPAPIFRRSTRPPLPPERYGL
eukprot:Em0001g695a